ncbi:MAG TPA: hypothetical protein VFN21_06480 [Acidimicrobiales bacterium]|nr:hypothetical protein [Acidimicrobiales bacterium]
MKTSAIRGVPSGVLLVLLGLWVALIPFVGPIFDYSIGSTDAWTWQTGWLWLSVLPGAAAVLAGLVMIGTFRRMSVGSAGILAAVAGGWIVVAPQVSRVWNDGIPASGSAFGSADMQVLELLGYSLLSGLLIALLGAFEIGHNSVRPADEVVAEDYVAVPPAPASRGGTRPRHAATGARNRPGARTDTPPVRH